MTDSALLLDRLLDDPVALSRRQLEADRIIAASGAGHLVHETRVHGSGTGDSGPWRIDPIPIVLDGATFDTLAAAVTARMQVFEAILDDLYGARNLVGDGVVAGEALSASPRYRVSSVGMERPSRRLTTYAVDVVALADGTWRVVQDLTNAPTGVGFALIDRAAMVSVADEVLGAGAEGSGQLASIAGFPAELRHALVATSRERSPRLVLLSGGVGHPAYVEHSSLARTLGFTMVERPDLVVRQGRVWLRTLGRTGGTGLDPVDVVYRRVGDAGLDPVELGAASDAGDGGVPGLLEAASNGGVVLANAHGAGLIEDAELAGAWADAATALGAGSLPLEPLDDAALQHGLATYPAFRAGEVTTTAASVRLHAVAGPDGVAVMAGGNGRVLAPGDDPRQPQARRAKDVWVVDYRVRPTIVSPPLPQVDLAESVPTRAAEAMFWTGRALERADSITRLVHVVSDRRRQDPGLARYAEGAWTDRMVAALRAVRGGDGGERGDGGAGADPRRSLDEELDASLAALETTLRGLIATAASVGEFLAAHASRSLAVLADRLERLDDTASPIDVLDDILAALASFMGMWNESMVRGPAWRFGEIGLRAERARVVVRLLAACVADAADDPGGVADEAASAVLAASVEVMLAANESLVAYRRRYRSDVEVPAVLDLMLRDRDNPRSFLSCLDRVAEHVADIEWGSGYSKIAALARLAHAVDQSVEERVAAATSGLDALFDDVVARWFATPVKPQLVRHRRPTSRARSGVESSATGAAP